VAGSAAPNELPDNTHYEVRNTQLALLTRPTKHPKNPRNPKNLLDPSELLALVDTLEPMPFESHVTVEGNLQGQKDSQPVKILIDSGAPSVFISKSFAERQRIHLMR